MEGLVNLVNGIIWSPALIYLCLGAGLFYSILTYLILTEEGFILERGQVDFKQTAQVLEAGERQNIMYDV